MAGRKILLVDDSRSQLDRLGALFTREGYQVTSAGDGREAIRKVAEESPDLIILDVVMPDMDGTEVLRVLKARAQEIFTPIILLSVKADLESRVAGLRIGADDFVPKPFEDIEILARAVAMLRIKELQDQIRQSRAELERLSVTDELTGLYNHRYFQTRMTEELHRAQRYNDPVSLIIIDLDHFKQVNDRNGHLFGNTVLQDAAHTIQRAVREPDVCARYGGEEFCVILPKTHVQGALVVAERISKALASRTYPAGDREERVTASMGLAFFPAKDITSAETLVRFADEALYQAKAKGRNAICLYESQVHGHAGGK